MTGQTVWVVRWIDLDNDDRAPDGTGLVGVFSDPLVALEAIVQGILEDNNDLDLEDEDMCITEAEARACLWEQGNGAYDQWSEIQYELDAVVVR